MDERPAETPLFRANREIAAAIRGAPEATVAQAVEHLPGWLDVLRAATGRRLDPADAEDLWAEVDALVLEIRPGDGPDRHVPIGVLAVLALAAAHALRLRIGGQLGLPSPNGPAEDVVRWAEIGFQPAVVAPTLAVNLGRKVFERYTTGASASVLGLGREALGAAAAPIPTPEGGALVPCLQPPDWGRSEALQRPLLGGRVRIPGVPIVAFAVDYPHHRQILADGDLEQVEAEALAHLEARPWPPPREVMDGVWVIAGEYADSLILSASTLRMLAERLGGGAILVGIPVRGVLFASPDPADPVRSGALVEIVHRMYAAGEASERLTTGVFVVEDGAPVRFLPGAEDVAPAVAPAPIEVDGATITVRLGPGRSGTIAPAVAEVMRERRFGAPVRVVVRIEPPASPMEEIDLLGAVALAREQLPTLVGQPGPEVVAQVGDRVVLSALDGLDPGEVEALALAPAAVAIAVAGVRGGMTADQLEAVEQVLPGVGDRRILEALVRRQQLFRDGIAALAHDPSKVPATLAVVREVLQRLPPAEASATHDALMKVAVITAARHAVRGPDGRLSLDAAHQQRLSLVAMLIGVPADGPVE